VFASHDLSPITIPIARSNWTSPPSIAAEKRETSHEHKDATGLILILRVKVSYFIRANNVSLVMHFRVILQRHEP
jgi:hypothetical protein